MSVEIRECDFGKGVFSKNDFEKNQCIWSLYGIVQTVPTRTTIHIGDNKHVDDKFGIYFNHSFEPNCAIIGQHVIALRDIPADSHLTFDYTSSEKYISSPFQTKDGRWVKK